MVEPDAALLDRLARGDEGAFEALFLRYYDQVYRIGYGLVGERQGAEDLAQETFLALYQQPPAPKQDTSLAAWLGRVTLNRGYNLLRGAQRQQRRLEATGVAPEQLDPQAILLRKEERMHIRDALARLPERQAKLLLLRHAGLKYAEIAAALELAPGSIGTLLVRAEQAFIAAYAEQNLAEH